jgi:hypothetical protein
MEDQSSNDKISQTGSSSTNSHTSKDGLVVVQAEEKPSYMYDVIETMLPQACYSEANDSPANNNIGTRMLEL